MNPFTILTLAMALAMAIMFFAVTASEFFKRQSEADCFAVADTPAKLAICKGIPYKEQQ